VPDKNVETGRKTDLSSYQRRHLKATMTDMVRFIMYKIWSLVPRPFFWWGKGNTTSRLTDWLSVMDRMTLTWNLNLTFRGPCIVIYSY